MRESERSGNSDIFSYVAYDKIPGTVSNYENVK